MTVLKKREPVRNSDTFIVDSSYFRAQAREALLTFMAPLSGVYSAATGTNKSNAKRIKLRKK